MGLCRDVRRRGALCVGEEIHRGDILVPAESIRQPVNHDPRTRGTSAVSNAAGELCREPRLS